jgi:hypothetical protein
MRPSEMKNEIKARIKAEIKRPILIESSPGLGKTQIAAQIAKDLGISFKAIHAPLLQPEDYGFPVISADKKDVDFIVSKEKFPLVDSDCADSGILLIDELSQADNNCQKILRNLIQEREIHGKKLKPGWTIIATGNNIADRAGANAILSHLSNVMTRVTLDPSLDDWTQWALNSGVKTEVIAFLRFRPDLLTNFNPQNKINATPRSWAEGVSKSLGLTAPKNEAEIFKGDVGEGPASEFLGFLQIFRKLPSPDAIILDPENSPIPSDGATLYAITCAMAYRTSADNFGRVMKYIKRLPPEFGVLYVRDSLSRCPAIAVSKGFISWASTDGAKLLT